MHKALGKKDLINLWIQESENYTTVDKIDNLLQSGQDLSLLPVQPLYVALKNLSVEEVSKSLIRLSPEQRELFLDLDLWVKDSLDISSFTFWICAYHLCQDEEVKTEFVKSAEFALFLKAKFNIWTFDVEEPEYPDHDNFFLTDDSLLLFEFDEDYEYVHEVKELVKHIYYIFGVEFAYTYLFKMVTDSISFMQEEEFQLKKSRLGDVGIIDYYDSLEVENCFPSMQHVEVFLKKKENSTARLDAHQINQSLHHGSLISFKGQLDSLSDELEKITSQMRIDYLHFNFLRLVNGTLAFSNAMKGGSVAMTRVGNRTLSFIELGFDYLLANWEPKEGDLFDYFVFTDLYKIGHSLVQFLRKDLKSALMKTSFEIDDADFLGKEISGLLDLVFSDTLKVIVDEKIKVVQTINELSLVTENSQFVIEILPFIEKFYQTIQQLKDAEKIQDDFYLNYNVAEIDFEAIFISSFANHYLGHYKNNKKPKMGLTLDEFKAFQKMILGDHNHLKGIVSLDAYLRQFFLDFGMDKIPHGSDYLYNILSEQFDGYEFSKMKDEEYKHVGGVILLNT